MKNKVKIKNKVEVTKKDNYTYRNLYNDLKSGRVVSVPELLQRILPKDVWTSLVANSYMTGNFVFEGGSQLQTFIFITKKALSNALNQAADISLSGENVEFIERAIKIIEGYKDAEEFIIDGQSRGLLALVPFFDNKIEYTGTIAFENGNSYSDFYWNDLQSDEKDAILDQVIDGKVVTKGSLKNAAKLVVGINTNNPFTQSGKNWLIWFDILKFKISDDIIYYYNLPALCSPKYISEKSGKYGFSVAGHIQLLFETIHLIKNINCPANYKLPDASMYYKILEDPTSYMKKIHLDSEEYNLLKILIGTLASIQLTDIKIPKYANAMNLLIKYHFIFNSSFERGQNVLEKLFSDFKKYKTKVAVVDRKEFARVMIEEEIKSMSINQYELDENGDVKVDSNGKKIDDREGIKYIMQSTTDVLRMQKRFDLIEVQLNTLIPTLKDRGIIKLIHERQKENWYDVFNKTSGTKEDMFGRPISDIHYLENKDNYDIGHIISNNDGGEEIIENKELEDAHKNKKKGDRSY